jgi:hypothetical protein
MRVLRAKKLHPEWPGSVDVREHGLQQLLFVNEVREQVALHRRDCHLQFTGSGARRQNLAGGRPRGLDVLPQTRMLYQEQLTLLFM